MKVNYKTVQQPMFKKLFPSVFESDTSKTELQNDELNIIKIETINVDTLEFRFAEKLAEKKKWLERFRKAYRGLLHPMSMGLFDSYNKYLIASTGGIDVGFLRLADYQFEFASVTDKPIWNISDGYVKPAYQSQGVLRAMIEYSVKECHAKSLTLTHERFNKVAPYYKALGFTVVGYDRETRCYRLYLPECEEYLIKTVPRIKVSTRYS